MFPLVETIRFEDGQFHNIELHQKRMDRSRSELYGDTVQPLSILKEMIQPATVNPAGTYKVRVVYGQRVGYIEWLPYHANPVHSFTLIEDNAIDYHLKYVDRHRINSLSKAKGDADTIIIIKNEMITDMAYGNLLFWDGDIWVTPSTPLLKGVMRERLLLDDEIEERDISVKDLKSYYAVRVINAMISPERCEQMGMDAILNLADFTA